MKKLIFSATIALLFASSTSSVRSETNAKFTHVFDGIAYPQNATFQRSEHQFEVHVQGEALSELSIDLPEEVSINQGIEVTDRSGKKIAATVSNNDKKATIVFFQPIAPETTITVSMRGVNTPGYDQVWQYRVFGKKVGMSEQIALGVAEIWTYR